jgi:hypothetical protein
MRTRLPRRYGKTDWGFTVGEHQTVLSRLQQHPHTLGDITRKIFVGLQTSADKIYVLEVREERKDTVLCYSKQLDEVVEMERGLVKPFLGKACIAMRPSWRATSSSSPTPL